MQSEHQPQPELDDDILQCKADVRKALEALRRKSSEAKSLSDDTPELPVQSLEPAQPSESAKTEPTAPLSDALAPQAKQSPVGIRILPFESLNRKQPAPSTSAPSEDRDVPTPEAATAVEPQAQVSAEPETIMAEADRAVTQLDEKIRQINELTEQNRRFAEDLDTSAQSVSAKQTQIETLERELADKISELAAIKQAEEENAAAIAELAGQVRQSGSEKTEAEKQLAQQADEWAKTLEAMKAAQETAARTLIERQQQLEALRGELADVEARLAESDAANIRLARENTELVEALHDARMQTMPFPNADEDEAFENQDAESYCESTEDIISEDDVHLEQKLTPADIPTFNLAEQIMAEQRKTSAARRQGPAGTGKPARETSIEHVMQQYVSQEPPEAGPTEPQQTPPMSRPNRFVQRQGEILSDYQKSLLGDIVRKDIDRLCRTRMSFASAQFPMGN